MENCNYFKFIPCGNCLFGLQKYPQNIKIFFPLLKWFMKLVKCSLSIYLKIWNITEKYFAKTMKFFFKLLQIFAGYFWEK